MPDSEYLQNTIDLGTQAKFTYAYKASPGYANADVLYEVYDYFGIVVVQTTNGVTVTLPTTGLGLSTLHYFRQITNHYDSTQVLVVQLSVGRTITLSIGESCHVFWSGSEWLSSPGAVESQESVQGRIEDPTAKSYIVINGTRSIKYLSKVYLNTDSGTADVSILKNGTTVTSANISLSGGTESQYTFTTKIEVGTSDVIAFQFSNISKPEGVHYRIDLDESST